MEEWCALRAKALSICHVANDWFWLRIQPVSATLFLVYRQASRIPRSFWDVGSSAKRSCSGTTESKPTDRFLWGSTGATNRWCSHCCRAARGCEPLRHPISPGLSLTGVRLVLRLTTRRGFPCVHAVATTPAQRLGVLLCSSIPVVSAFPDRVFESACASSFSRIAQRSHYITACTLALSPIRDTLYPKASAISLPP